MHRISSHKLAPAHQRMGRTCGQREEGQQDGIADRSMSDDCVGLSSLLPYCGSQSLWWLPVNLTSEDLCLCGLLPLG